MKILKTLMLGAALAAVMPVTAMAEETASGSDLLSASRFQLRARMIGVIPQEDSSVSIGGEANVDNAYVPELDLSYFLTDKIGLELIAATARHTVHYNYSTKLGDTWVLPPTVTLQYHPLRGQSNFSPYVGAGLNYTWFYAENDADNVDDLDLTGGVGYALQVGADYWINKNWGLNVDVKKIWLNVDADMAVGGTPVTAEVDLDPVVAGIGVSYRF